MIISWNTTNQCNMFCRHCYRDAGVKASKELTTGEGKLLLDEIAKAGFKIMIFSGGEPLMRSDIYELIEHSRKLSLRPVLGSNGVLITKKIAQKLKDSGVMRIGISLDSIKRRKHDMLRGYPGAWDKAVRGMKYCREVQLPFQIHTTVMDWNQHEVLDIADFAVETGAVAHHIFFLVPAGRAKNIEEESLRARQYEDLLVKLMEKQREVKIEIKPVCAPQFICIAKEMGMDLRFGRGCLAGIAYCIISPEGKVQPCAYLDIEAGNVRKTPFSEIWSGSKVFKKLRTCEYKGGCGTCRYQKICGGCRARAAFYNDGDYMAEDPWCIYQERRGV
ncbi:MAG: putative heme d1 biosynthesis radical SAM protein NirJ2 [Actinobacteria bacterium]|nr:putative heme d1 biosynthesis radical SAM protein NirJ2 [Actinomycetota bacterium]